MGIVVDKPFQTAGIFCRVKNFMNVAQPLARIFPNESDKANLSNLSNLSIPKFFIPEKIAPSQKISVIVALFKIYNFFF